MFDVGFSELLVIALVALIVLGPERLPKVARTVGNIMGRARHYMNDVKSDLQREMELNELRQLRDELKNNVQQMERNVQQSVDELRDEWQATVPTVNVAENIEQLKKQLTMESSSEKSDDSSHTGSNKPSITQDLNLSLTKSNHDATKTPSKE